MYCLIFGIENYCRVASRKSHNPHRVLLQRLPQIHRKRLPEGSRYFHCKRNQAIEVCGRCGGSLKVIACIEDQDIIDRILAHLREKEQEAPARPLLVPPTRAPPATLSLFAGTELNQQGRH